MAADAVVRGDALEKRTGGLGRLLVICLSQYWTSYALGEIELVSPARESNSGVALATVVTTCRKTIHKRKSKSDREPEVCIREMIM
ncbi:hypothetical protein NL676_030712 [Syzygium grande]|nr:hypothetical protein NL676_030712 [Syzygium grande]